MIPAARHHRTPLHASWPPFRDSISARAPSSERWRCSTRLLVVVYNGHSCAAAVVCHENNGRIAQRWQPETGTAPTRALSAPLACARGRLDRSRTVQGRLSLLVPDGWQVNRGKQSEAERRDQFAALQIPDAEVKAPKRPKRGPILSETRSADAAAAHAIRMRELGAAEEAEVRPDFVVCCAGVSMF